MTRGGLASLLLAVSGVAALGDCGAHGERCGFGDDEANLVQLARLVRPQKADQCGTDLGEKCGVRPCSNRVGPSECRSGRCYCQPGFCMDAGGSCVSPARTVWARVLPVKGDASAAAFPPGQQEVRLGLASSGGGARALSFSVGVLRGLLNIGVLPTIDMITSVSGGSWAAAALVYADRPYEALLGSPTAPRELTLEALSRPSSEIGNAMNTSSTRILFEFVLAGKTPIHELWSRTIGRMFLKPFNLAPEGLYLARAEEDVERIKRRNPQLRDARFVTPRPGRPELAITASLLAPRGYAPGADSAVLLQVTPGYIGSPYHPNGGEVTYTRLGSDEGQADMTRAVGGGFVEAFAFNGGQPLRPSELDAGEAVEVGAPPVPFSLSDAIGASSWEPGAKFASSVAGLVDPRATYWPVASKQGCGALPYKLGDGGNLDNSGVLAMLQRRPSKVIWVASVYKTLNFSYPWKEVCDCGDACFKDFDPIAAGVIDTILDKFGYGVEVSKEGYLLTHNQIFEQRRVLPLACDIWRLASSGKPPVVEMTAPVLANAWWGVSAATSVKFVIIYLAESQDFTNQLPRETRDEIGRGTNGMFANWPIFKTTQQNEGDMLAYTLPQINLLGALGEYFVKQNAAMFMP